MREGHRCCDSFGAVAELPACRAMWLVSPFAIFQAVHRDAAAEPRLALRGPKDSDGGLILPSGGLDCCLTAATPKDFET
jgi:hypothetical protein